jgi:hypothetical protein
MSIYSSFQTDVAAESDGIVLDFGDYQFTIARAGGANKRFEQALKKRLDRYKRMIEFDALPEATARQAMIEVYAETVVLGWSGITGPDEQEIPFSREACVKLFSDLPGLFDVVREESGKLSNFLAKRRQEIAGN